MSWGKGIIIAFIFFAAFIATLVTVCIKQEMSLVSKDYYQEELDYQQQIQRIENTSKLSVLPSITITNDSLKLVFDNLGHIKGGVLKLTRASSARHDASFTLPEHTGREVVFPLSNLPRGRYTGSFQWVMDGKEYYFNQPVDL